VTLDDQQSQAAASHLNYEVKVMAELYAWTLRFEETGPAVLKNACLEATLIHMRLLIEFVAGRRKSQTDPRRRWSNKDIQPKNFLSGWLGLPDGRLDGYLELTDQYVAHLSLVRAQTIAARGWSLERMVDAVLIEFEHFTDAVERSGSPTAVPLRSGLSEARQLKTRPPRPWPPSADISRTSHHVE
jgi:hypothetical protein